MTIIITNTMPTSDSAPDPNSAAPRNWFKRIGWLLLIWVASTAALGAAAYALRLVMRLIGMST